MYSVPIARHVVTITIFQSHKLKASYMNIFSQGLRQSEGQDEH